MAKVDVNNLPSEDEEFDSVSDAPANDEEDQAPVDTSQVETSEAPVAGDVISPAASEDNPADASNDDSQPAEASSFSPSPTSPKADDITAPAKSSAKPSATVVGGQKAGWRPSAHMIVEAALLLVVIGLGLLTWTFYSDKQNLSKQVASLNANPQAAVQKQTDAIIASVAQLMQLPTGETPTVAAVSDASAAKQQSAFFDNAQNGDKVLMYVKAGEAILYRPSTNKIVLVAPLTFNNPATAASTTPTTSTSKTSK